MATGPSRYQKQKSMQLRQFSLVRTNKPSNERTRKVKPNRIVVQGWLMESIPWIFDVLQYFETILLSEVYFVVGGAAGGLRRQQLVGVLNFTKN